MAIVSAIVVAPIGAYALYNTPTPSSSTQVVSPDSTCQTVVMPAAFHLTPTDRIWAQGDWQQPSIWSALGAGVASAYLIFDMIHKHQNNLQSPWMHRFADCVLVLFIPVRAAANTAMCRPEHCNAWLTVYDATV